MSYTGTFRLLLTLQVLLSFAVPAIGYYCHESLPQPIREYLDSPDSVTGTTSQLMDSLPFSVLLIMTIATVLILLIDLIGLWLMRNWARHLYLAITIIGFALYMVDYQTPIIFSTAEGVLWDILNIVTGATIAMMYLPPLAARFKAPATHT